MKPTFIIIAILYFLASLPGWSEETAETVDDGMTYGRQLALPDISLIVQAKGLASTDKNDPGRNRLNVSEAELAVQGYVYPRVKADAFLVTSPAEHVPMEVEEAYLAYLGLLPGANLYVGKKHVAFGRTNLVHSHSWLYVNQPYAIRDLIAHESLIGQGLAFNYVIPTRGNLFAKIDIGTWSGAPHEHEHEEDSEIMVGPGANLSNRFNTLRLWTAAPTSENMEIEFGGSYAEGTSLPHQATGTNRVRLSGLDLSLRRFGAASRRSLFRTEHFWRRGTTDSGGALAKGVYVLADYRPNRYLDLGLLYSWSQFPQAVELHESALSVILTKQFSEQYYVRFQVNCGSRPDDHSFTEFWLQWTWGVGPHTHNLE